METKKPWALVQCCSGDKPLRRQEIITHALEHFEAFHEIRGETLVADDDAFSDRYVAYRSNRFLTVAERLRSDRLVLLRGQDIRDDALNELARKLSGKIREVLCFGQFEDAQHVIGQRNRILYNFDVEPVMCGALKSGRADGFLELPGADFPLALPLAPAESPRLVDAPPRALVHLSFSEDLDWKAVAAHVQDAERTIGGRVALLVRGQHKKPLAAALERAHPIYQYSEMTAAHAARRFDCFVEYGEFADNDAVWSLRLNVVRSGGFVVDCTVRGAETPTRIDLLRAPRKLAALGETIATSRRNRGRIAKDYRAELSAFLAPLSGRTPSGGAAPKLVADSGPSARRGASAETAPRVVFYATNGNGLGHAQRCLAIAKETAERERVAFAAHPSCIRLVGQLGSEVAPLISRTDDTHAVGWANDLANLQRLRAMLRPGDVLAFDGGYVFDSICQIRRDFDLRTVWIRRELFRADQDNSVLFDREKYFDQVIVPTECFDELNDDRHAGAFRRRGACAPVGPIVQTRARPTDRQRAATRAQIAKRLGVPFDTLLVSMLGGGVASDRNMQLKCVSAAAERHPNMLHLIVKWPTATMAPGFASFKRTRLVSTMNALALAQCADFVVSAAGYNSFHELLYHRVPTLFVPQSAQWLDDQERRAKAAESRGLAAFVEPERLATLFEMINPETLADRAARLGERLAEWEAPERGNADAAQALMEASDA